MNNVDDKKYAWIFLWWDSDTHNRLSLNDKTQEQAFDEARFFGWRPRSEVVPKWKFWSKYKAVYVRF